MKISELVSELEVLWAQHGDIEFPTDADFGYYSYESLAKRWGWEDPLPNGYTLKEFFGPSQFEFNTVDLKVLRKERLRNTYETALKRIKYP